MAQPPRPHVIDDPRVLARLLAEHLPVPLEEIPAELPDSAADLLLIDQDIEPAASSPTKSTVPGSNPPA